MQKTVQGKGNKLNEKFGWLPELDRLLIAGIKHGPAQKKDAITKILQLVPGWTREDCWQRIRHLRKSPEFASPAEGHSDKAKNPGRTLPVRRPSSMPWTPAHDDKLLKLAGYETVNKIAQRLGRSERAVRCRLGALGISGKVTDGWSLRTLQTTLRVRRPRLRQLIGKGMLKVRDPRISASSLAVLCDKMRASLDPSAIKRIAAALANGMRHTPGNGQPTFLVYRCPKYKSGFLLANCESWTRLSPTGRLRSSARSTATRSIWR